MSILQKIKSLFGGDANGEHNESDTTVTVEREPGESTDTEHASADGIQETHEAEPDAITDETEADDTVDEGAVTTDQTEVGKDDDSDEYDADEGEVEEPDSDEGETDETDADEGEVEEPDSDEGEVEEPDSDEGEADETDADEGEVEAADDEESSIVTEADEANVDKVETHDSDAEESKIVTETGDDDSAGEPIERIKGIGPAYGNRLGDIGIETVTQLAAADPAEVAEQTGVGESRASTWIDRAKEF